MPNNSLLFSLNNEGRVYALSTNGSFWREFMYLGIEFKTLSAIPHFLWAVGGDRQIYVHVHGLEIPIRVKEEAFENERWLPLEGFCSRLLPTDRYHFSSQDGTVDRAIDRIRLPSMAWQWEGDWQLDLTLDGQPLDHDGWSYAIDFPAQFGPTKKWKSCVRRRKWVRCRKYSAMNSWCAIAPLHKDPTQEPFIDVSIGGNQIPHAPATTLTVWAITAHGRVMFRSGVSLTAPEGLRWTNIAIPPSTDVKQISVGPTGLVWALLWTGRCLVRKAVTRTCLHGESWLEIKSPNDTKLSVISVGYDSVWALSSDGRVWFRKGINGNGAGVSEGAAMGIGWIEIGGNMTHISVAPNDQVFAVGESDKIIYWRFGITPTELSGKRWKCLEAPLHLSRTSSMASVSSRSPRAKHCSLITLNHSLSETQSESILDDSWEESHSAPIQRTLPVKPLSSLNTNVQKTIPTKQSVSESEQLDVSGKSFEITLKNPRAWSPVRSVGSVVGMEAHPESDSSVFDGDSGLYCEDEVDQAAWGECDTVWNFVEAGGCIVDGYQLPHWFANSHTGPSIELSALWRLQLLKDLKSRNEFGEIDLSKYGQAIEYKGWSRSGEARQIYANGVSEDCVFSINWHSVENTGTLSVLNPDGATIKFILNLGEVTCVIPSSEPGYPRISIFAPRRFNDAIKLQFNSENEQEEWLNLLVDIMCQTNGLSGRPSSDSVWAVTSLGDVLTWDRQTLNSSAESNGLYTKEFNVYGKDASNGFSTPLYNNFLVGSELEIKGCLYDVVDKFAINLQGPARLKRKHKLETEVLDIPLHFNPRFGIKVVVRNSKIKGEWGNEEREGEFPFISGQEFVIKLVCLNEGYHIYVNDILFAYYRHRLPPEMVDTLGVSGQLKLYSIEYKSKNVIIGTDEMIWRIIGGHLRKVETSSGGVTWGISHDHAAWVYTGGWGGGMLKGIESSSGAINNMTDTQNYFVYENQRWNPLTGYTSSGLPTDRYMWSDVTGRHKRTREHTKLLNKHWHWISEWIVDYNTPGGVDSDGWQYATDFPALYHGRKLFTDCVRRRRWFRRAQLATAGPWSRAGNTAIFDVSLWSSGADKGITDVWAIASTGDAVYRSGVSADCPIGSSWLHVSSPQPLSAVSVYDGVVWALGRKGEIYMRVGMTLDNPTGNCWRLVEAPKVTVTAETKSSSGGGVRALTLSQQCAWILLSSGKITVRMGIDMKTPAGKEWKYLTDSEVSFKHISSGIRDIWAIGNDGKLYRRAGVSAERPLGTSWTVILNAGCVHVSARGSFATGSSWLHVSSPQPLSAVSVYDGVVWALGRKGEIYMRVGMTLDNPTGNCWRLVEAPKVTVTAETKSSSGGGVRALTLSQQCAWILLSSGKITVRMGIDMKTPAGKEWKYLTDSEVSFKHISSGIRDIWAIGNDGKLYRRAGVSAERPLGTSWTVILNAGCVHVSARGSFATV